MNLTDLINAVADVGLGALRGAVKVEAAALGLTISDDLIAEVEAAVRALFKPGPGITHAKTLVVDDQRST